MSYTSIPQKYITLIHDERHHQAWLSSRMPQASLSVNPTWTLQSFKASLQKEIMPRLVNCTSHISFSEQDKTFRLYAGASIYAFCLSSELGLEHLHWGQAIPPEYDLRYLGESSRFSNALDIQRARSATSTSDNVKGDMAASNVLKKINPSPGTSQSNISKEYPSNMMHRSYSTPDLEGLRADLQVSDIKDITRNVTHGMGAKDRQGRASAFEDAKVEKKAISVHSRAETFERKIGKIGKGGICLEYSDHGTGDFRTPSFVVVDNFNGSSVTPLRYRRHRIYKGKLNMPDDMPSIRCVSEDEASTLVVTLADSSSGLEVDLIFVCMHDYDVITRRTVIRNIDRRDVVCSNVMIAGSGDSVQCGSSKVILKATSFSLDFEAEPEPFYQVQLSGSWGRERYIEETKLSHGNHCFGSTRGVSSHQANPFACITIGAPHESHGEVRAFSLVYSGNFLWEAELGELGRLRVCMGLHPMGLQWHLQTGEEFCTPEVVMVRSSEGLGGMSRTLHRVFLDRLIPHTWADEHPPILLNTWEA
eukprot:gene36624-44427_t